jgi:transcriptional regulator with XRE-family HTH domain
MTGAAPRTEADAIVHATTPRGFGQHIRSLRKARDFTQQDLADRSDLAADTIRRLEGEEFSPSLRTLQCVVGALGIRMSTLFLGYELDDRAAAHELIDLLAGRPEWEVRFVFGLVKRVLRELDAYRSGVEVTQPQMRRRGS